MLSRPAHSFAVACLHAEAGSATSATSLEALDFFSPAIREAVALLATVHEGHPGALQTHVDL